MTLQKQPMKQESHRKKKNYTVYYKDEAGDDLTEASTVRALFGSSQTLDAPDVAVIHRKKHR